jgi:hypothetical protein
LEDKGDNQNAKFKVKSNLFIARAYSTAAIGFLSRIGDEKPK